MALQRQFTDATEGPKSDILSTTFINANCAARATCKHESLSAECRHQATYGVAIRSHASAAARRTAMSEARSAERILSSTCVVSISASLSDFNAETRSTVDEERRLRIMSATETVASSRCGSVAESARLIASTNCSAVGSSGSRSLGRSILSGACGPPGKVRRSLAAVFRTNRLRSARAQRNRVTSSRVGVTV